MTIKTIVEGMTMNARHLRYTRKKRKINLKRLLLLFLFFCIITVMPMVYSSFFGIKVIHIKGNKTISSEKIMQVLNGYYGKNLLSVKEEHVKQSITSCIPVEEVKIKYKLPSTLIVGVKERQISAAIQYLSGFILIDSKGFVVRFESKLGNYSLPIVTGLTIVDSSVAKIPVVEEGRAYYDKLIQLISSLKTLSPELSEIHVTTKPDDDVEFNLYTLDGYQIVLDYLDDGKISMIENVLRDLRSNDRGKGIIDVKHDIPVFRPY